jgi:hypothetical protein
MADPPHAHWREYSPKWRQVIVRIEQFETLHEVFNQKGARVPSLTLAMYPAEIAPMRSSATHMKDRIRSEPRSVSA